MTYNELLQQKYFSLPKSLQDAIRSDENNKFLVNLAKKYTLNENQQMDLIYFSAHVILGEVSRSDFARRIMRINGVGEAAAQAMAKAIDEKLFAPLAEKIDEALRDRISTDAVESPDQESGTKEQETQREGVAFVPPETSTPQKWRMPREAVVENSSATTTTPASEPSLSSEEPEEAIALNKPPQQEKPETHKLTNSKTGGASNSQTNELAQPQADEQLAPDIITIPTITITKPPRFIPLKDLKQGSIKARPAPQGVPSRDTIPNFSSATPRTAPQDAIHTLKNDATPVAIPTTSTQAPTPSVLPRIEPTPEKLASTFVAPQPQITVPKPPVPTTATPKIPNNDPYHEPIDDTQGKPIDAS